VKTRQSTDICVKASERHCQPQISKFTRFLKAYQLANDQLQQEQVLVVGTKQSRLDSMAGRLTGRWADHQVGWQGRWVDKAGGLTRQVDRQVGWPPGWLTIRWADKEGGLTRQVGWQCRWADKAGWQGRWADKAGGLYKVGGLKRQVGQQSRWASQYMCPL
jgi:hypothetical protein